jgi:hypothetical protein
VNVTESEAEMQMMMTMRKRKTTKVLTEMKQEENGIVTMEENYAKRTDGDAVSEDGGCYDVVVVVVDDDDDDDGAVVLILLRCSNEGLHHDDNDCGDD